MSALKTLREKQAALVAEARSKLDDVNTAASEAAAKEIEQQYDAIMVEHDKLEARAKREEALARAEEAVNAPDPRRPVGEDRSARSVDPVDAEKRHTEAFATYLRTGDVVPMREFRAQSVGTTTAGGYTVPQGFAAELIKSLKMWGPMLDPGITREIVTAGGNNIQWPTMNDTSNVGVRIAENTDATSEGDVVFGQKSLDAYKYSSGPILVSAELLQDSALSVESIIRDAMAERIARKVNADLTTGDGSGDPNGIVTATSAGLTAADDVTISFDDLIDLVHSIDPAYRVGSSVGFMFNDSTLKALRKIKDSNGLYIWQPADVRTGAPASILGYTYHINQAMASIAAASKPVVFGAFDKYIVRRVREFAVRRLDERYATADQVGFIGFCRYDGDLMDTGAVKHLITAAS